MCIVFFESHHDGPREHYVGSYHCTHTDCPGTFESHHRFLLEDTVLHCTECLAKDGVQTDSSEVKDYPPIPHFELEYIDGKGWMKAVKQGNAKGTEKGVKGESGCGNQGNVGTENGATGEQNGEEHDEEEDEEEDMRGDYRSLSDCDSVTSHWRLDPIFASRARSTATTTREKSLSLPCQDTPAAEESFKTREAFDPYEVEEIAEPHYESASNQDPNIPDQSETPFGDSPSTIEHRNLVNRQLFTLTHPMAYQQYHNSRPRFNGVRPQRMAHHRRQNNQSGFGVVRPQSYAFPAMGTPGPPGPPWPLAEQQYLYPAVPESELEPTWVWVPIPQPYPMVPYPPVGRPGSWTKRHLLTVNSFRETLSRTLTRADGCGRQER
jgi:hypothetical protein